VSLVSDVLRTAHPPAERLAALADELPTPTEAAHLAECATCREEHAAYVALVAVARDEGAAAYALAHEHDRPAAAEDDDAAWTAIAGTLRAEGLATRQTASTGRLVARPEDQPRVRRLAFARDLARRVRVGRLAAGVALAVSAGAAGRLSATRGPWSTSADGVVGAALGDAASAPSPDEARRVLARARQEYLQAAAVLAAADPAGDPSAGDASAGDASTRAATGAAPTGGQVAAGLPSLDSDGAPARGDAAPDAPNAELLRARLAALDAMLPRVRAAAQAAPQDPAVNHVYLTAYDAREAALRKLGQSMPAGVRLTGY
jgi:hypothetical protein